MQMFEDTGAVLLNMLRLMLYGGAAGLALEAVNGWNAAVRPKKKLLFAADLGWCLSAAFGFFMLLLAYADGALRLLWFVCAGAGYLLYRRLLGRHAKRAFSAFFRVRARARRLLRRRVFGPVAVASKKIAIFLSKPLIFFVGCIKMALYRLKAGKVKRKIKGRKRRWLRERKKCRKKEDGCLE